MDRTEKAAAWIYSGIWQFVVDLFRVPDGPPNLVAQKSDGVLRVFHPSRRYLSYLKLYFWVGLVIIDGLILVGWIAILPGGSCS